MSKWTEIRDEIVNSLKVEEVTEEVKQQVSESIISNILPAVEQVADDFVGKVKAQAPSESGWCRIRDGIVLPLVIQGGIWAIKAVLNKSLAKS